MWPSASVSESGAPRSSGRACRIADGSVSPIRASRLLAPTASSIAAMSRGEGPIWRRANVVAAASARELRTFTGRAFTGMVVIATSSSGGVSLVGGLIHQAVEFAFVGDLHLEEPG